MEMPSLFEDCQTWIEKGQESWKSYFSKWETYAKYEENLTEGELMCERNERRRSRSQVKKKMKLPFPQKRLKILPSRRQHTCQKNPVKMKKKCRKIVSNTGEKKLHLSSDNESCQQLSTIIKDKQLEISLKTFFLNFLTANQNKSQVLSVLCQTYSNEVVTVTDLDNSVLKQMLPFNDSQLNLRRQSFESPQALSSPPPETNLIRSICPHRNTYIQSMCANFRGTYFKPSERSRWSNQHEDTNRVNEYSFSTHLSKQQFPGLAGGAHTPQMKPTLNLQVRSCPPFSAYRPRFGGTVMNSLRLNLCDKFSSNMYGETKKENFKNIAISKMNLTQGRKGLGDSCLHKRTNSVSLSMGNSNYTTPERKSSEQKHFNKIVSHRCLSKKLILQNEEDDSESDDQTEYRSPLIRCRNKRLKADKPLVVQSDSDDYDSIFDRVFKP